MNTKSTNTLPEHPHKEWRGYDIDEIRYQRAYTTARIEIEKERMLHNAQTLYSGGVNPRATGGLVGKMLGCLTYVDYAVLAFKLGKRIYAITRKLHR